MHSALEYTAASNAFEGVSRYLELARDDGDARLAMRYVAPLVEVRDEAQDAGVDAVVLVHSSISSKASVATSA